MKHFGSRWGYERQWAGVYDYLCATANHPTLLGFEYVEHDPDAGTTTLSMSADLLHRLVRAALVPFIKAQEHVVCYLGWDISPVNEFIDQVNASVLGEVFAESASD